MLRLDYVKTNPEKLERRVKVKSKQSDSQEGQGSKNLLEQFSQVASVISQQNVKVKSQQSNKQGGLGLKKLLVKFSHGQLKDKTLLIQHKSTSVRVLFSKNIKMLRQCLLSEMFK
ncbi:hypothetical protein M0802_015492 [Mischocyttarus mexicanus]|nr:hypothetical protein M0802_015492 [Mischocyttarus mexicanus]